MEKKISIVRKRYYSNLKNINYTKNIFCHHHHSGAAQRQGGVISVGVSLEHNGQFSTIHMHSYCSAHLALLGTLPLPSWFS